MLNFTAIAATTTTLLCKVFLLLAQQLVAGPSFLEVVDRTPEMQNHGCLFLGFLVSTNMLLLQVRVVAKIVDNFSMLHQPSQLLNRLTHLASLWPSSYPPCRPLSSPWLFVNFSDQSQPWPLAASCATTAVMESHAYRRELLICGPR